MPCALLFHSCPPFPYLFACLNTIFSGGKFGGEFGKLSVAKLKPFKLVFTINNLLADLLIHQIPEKSKFAKIFFHQSFLPYGTCPLVFVSDSLSILKFSQQLFIPVGYMRLNRWHYYTYIIIVFSEILHNTTVSYDKDWKLSGHSFSFANSIKLPLIDNV